MVKPVGFEDTSAEERIFKKVGLWEKRIEYVDLLSII